MKNISVILLSVFLVCTLIQAKDYYKEVPLSSPEDQGMNRQKLLKAKRYAFSSSRNTQAVIVMRNGYIVSEWYHGNYDKTDLVTSWSVSKSIINILIGIAIEKGYIPSEQTTVSTYITEWKETDKQNITIKNLLSMKSGLGSNFVRTNDLYQSKTPFNNSVNRKRKGIPQKKWSYLNEDTLILATILERATQQPIETFSKEHLLDPLNIDATWWVSSQNQPLGYCCFDATPQDFAKIGQLILQKGKWEEQSLINSEWIEVSTKTITPLKKHRDLGSFLGDVKNFGYGYHWWTWTYPKNNINIILAVGYAHQYI